jgi:hypothetical protein
MKLNTTLKILSLVVNGISVALLFNGVGKLAIILIVLAVSLVNYFEGLSYNYQSK